MNEQQLYKNIIKKWSERASPFETSKIIDTLSSFDNVSFLLSKISFIIFLK